jgi:hypothetical protein
MVEAAAPDWVQAPEEHVVHQQPLGQWRVWSTDVPGSVPLAAGRFGLPGTCGRDDCAEGEGRRVWLGMCLPRSSRASTVPLRHSR